MGFFNLIAIAVWPSWVSIAISETLRKVWLQNCVFYLHTNICYTIKELQIAVGHSFLIKICNKISNFVQSVKAKLASQHMHQKMECYNMLLIILQVVNYVVTRPARELLFTVVSQDEKYKAKVKASCPNLFPFYFKLRILLMLKSYLKKWWINILLKFSASL